MKYSEKLKDPRWQKKRLKILERDGWVCRECYTEEKTLHVHHLEYNGDPWDSPDDNLLTLCYRCHKKTEVSIKIAGGYKEHREIISGMTPTERDAISVLSSFIVDIDKGDISLAGIADRSRFAMEIMLKHPEGLFAFMTAEDAP